MVAIKWLKLTAFDVIVAEEESCYAGAPDIKIMFHFGSFIIPPKKRLYSLEINGEQIDINITTH